MAKYVSFLRAINVGGRNVIKMDALKQIYADLGLLSAVSHLQSGNVVFDTERSDEMALGAEIETEIEAFAGFRPEVILRTADALAKVIGANPFPGPAKDDPSHLLVMFLKETPSKAQAAALTKANRGPEACAIKGRDIYIHYSEGIGRSKFTNSVIERELGLMGTARNWNTVTRLVELAAG